MRVKLRIEELVLEGFAAGDRYHIGDALEAELVRLLAEQGVPPPLARGFEVAHQDGGEFMVAPDDKLEKTGEQAACAVYELLKR
jgi:hypothetical protein